MNSVCSNILEHTLQFRSVLVLYHGYSIVVTVQYFNVHVARLGT